jgi:NAD(P)-dependent dehydrogenase (short-subunit alcohol dehydrogenase family)
MELTGRVCVVTGGAGGIGSAVSRRFAAGGAKVVVADLDQAAVDAVADDIKASGGQAIGVAADIGSEAGNLALIDHAEAAFGPVDLFYANAGVGSGAGVEATDEDWDKLWRVNVMAHVWAARRLVPEWIAKGEGYLVTTASMAGILTSLGDGPYAATKHAAVGFAEWVAITHGSDGVRVSCLCPGAVNTPMLRGTGMSAAGAARLIGGGGVAEPDQVAEIVAQAVNDERFLILTHDEMPEYMNRQANDRDRWIKGMRRLWDRGRERRAAGLED